MVPKDVASTWPPPWIDAKGLNFRSYDDSPRVTVEGDWLTCGTDKGASKLVLWFGIPFTLVFLPYVYSTIDVPKFRAVFLLIGPLGCVGGFAVAYWLFRYQEQLGDYLVIDREHRSLELPRYDRTFSFDEVVSFQSISGYKEPFSHNLKRAWRSQLNLIIDEGGTPVRYHLIGRPPKKVVDAITDFSALPIVETSCPHGYYLCSDASGHQRPAY